MDALDGLLPFLDNGGRRSCVERRTSTAKYIFFESRLHTERRNISDRRKSPNLIRKTSLERRFFYRDQNEYLSSYDDSLHKNSNKIIILKNHPRHQK